MSTDLLSHSVDLAHMLLGPITRVVGHDADVHPRAAGVGPARPARTTARGSADDPRAAVTNEDYAGMLCEFAVRRPRHVRGEPDDRRAREPDGVRGLRHEGRARLEPRALNELQVYLVEDELHTGYRTVFGGDRFPYHGSFVPGSANGIGFEDLVVIEDLEFLRSVAERRRARAELRRRARVRERAGGAAAIGGERTLGGRR